MGTVTIIEPDQKTVVQTIGYFTMKDLPAGRYTLLIAPPKGMSTVVTISRGSEAISVAKVPQITFEIAEGESLSVDIQYTLSFYGSIVVTSDPASMPFELKGPNSMSRTGITPATFEKMPIGQYNVTFKPTGCNTPPPKSSLVSQNDRVSVNISLRCDTFTASLLAPSPAVSASSASASVSTDAKETVAVPSAAPVVADLTATQFADVHTTDWFYPYVKQMNEAGILTGYKNADGTMSGVFGSANAVNLAELAKIAHVMAHIPEPAMSLVPVNSLARNAWYSAYIASSEIRHWWLYDAPSADVTRPATRGEVLVTLLQAMDIPVHWAKGGAFADVMANTPYAAAIETAAERGWVSGTPVVDGQPIFQPLQPINRAALSKILSKMMEVR